MSVTSPTLIARSVDTNGEGNFPKGASFSPDGLCVLTNTASDNRLRLYNTPPITLGNESEKGEEHGKANKFFVDWKTALAADGCDSVRSYAWYPHMNSADPSSCCFLSSSRDQPIHLVDAYTAKIRASYRPYNALDEMESPTVATFSPDGQRIVAAGFRTDRTIHVFETGNPGRHSTILRLGKTRRSSDGQKGLVSALTFSSPQTCCFNKILAVGTYAPGSIYLYDDRVSSSHTPTTTILNGLCIVGHGRSHSRKKRRFVAISNDGDQDNEETENLFSKAKVQWFQNRARGGVTQMRFSPSEEYILYSSSRRSDAVLGWDVRMVSGNEDYASCPVRGFTSFATDNNTNQRIEFDFDETGKRLFVGGRDNCVRVYNVKGGELVGKIDSLGDVANGVSYKYDARLNSGMLAVAVGSRQFAGDDENGEQEELSKLSTMKDQGTLDLYRV
eukprot:CAMPEP_0195295812 /NCGR_PEP_ID=MMETSP0707-20130614/18113_1 /TAXON_ID=33640 /ORGANISM="Asterionellopsis glacialis, Strain CCMP134" /LENGTH=445 /DNA_ID=CAMNT_0040357133 /DNA_START=264 /DNA_END=1601 /DNA_ORIENTATION=-